MNLIWVRPGYGALMTSAKIKGGQWFYSFKECKPNGLVFPAPQGEEINDRGFRRRAWKKVLEKLDIKYRKP